jgi:phosphoadenosine phosphosulfate reductase
LDFRDWLIEIRNKPEYRQVERRNGTLTIKGGKHIPGPFTVEARQMILNRLLEVQTIYGSELITQEEIDLIKQIWADDLIALHSRKKIV